MNVLQLTPLEGNYDGIYTPAYDDIAPIAYEEDFLEDALVEDSTDLEEEDFVPELIFPGLDEPAEA